MPWYVFSIPVVFTLLGGALAIRWRAHAHLLIAAGTGLLLGATVMDLLPETLAIGAAAGYHPLTILMVVAASYILFVALDRLTDAALTRSGSRGGIFRAGHIGASLLIFHSFRDGMAIGAAFATSHHAGYVVALAIAAHDLGDGMNTILLTTNGERPRAVDYVFLLADAAAPFVGGLLMKRVAVSPRISMLLLSLAVGFFVQLMTGEFLPQLRRSAEPRPRLLACALTGFGVLLAVHLALQRWLP